MVIKIYCGTSGWFYFWNKERSLDWFVKNSDLNAIELNASFYRFPYPNQIKSWESKGRSLRWSVKVNRLITHVFRFGARSLETWKKFEILFKPLHSNIDFYLFQLPPSLTPNSAEKIEKFFRKTKLKEKFALECRNEKWFSDMWVKWVKKLGITLVSIDAPDFGTKVFNTNGIVYMRMHGRTAWYSHNYSQKELKEIAEKILEQKPKKLYVFFNNNHNMLSNAKQMMKILNRCA